MTHCCHFEWFTNTKGILQRYCLSDEVVGCLSNSGGAMHPYRFVTSLLSNLRSRYPDK